MITEERLKWLQENKEKGEVAQAWRNLNPTEIKSKISYPEAQSIIAGNLWGKWGQLFTDELERIIKERIKKVQLEKEKYSTAN